jgi:hypothetical protein
MAAHRLEPIPHQRDFPQTDDHRYVLPDTGSFAAMGMNDVCCDQGKYYPANNRNLPTRQAKVRLKGACPSIWLHCGFAKKDKNYKDPAVLLELHHRLLEYPFFNLQTGTRLPGVSAHQRVCVPRHGPANCADG